MQRRSCFLLIALVFIALLQAMSSPAGALPKPVARGQLQIITSWGEVQSNVTGSLFFPRFPLDLIHRDAAGTIFRWRGGGSRYFLTALCRSVYLVTALCFFSECHWSLPVFYPCIIMAYIWIKEKGSSQESLLYLSPSESPILASLQQTLPLLPLLFTYLQESER